MGDALQLTGVSMQGLFERRLPLNAEGLADANGRLQAERTADLPLSVSILSFELATVDGCLGRKHLLNVWLEPQNGQGGRLDLLAAAELSDCARLVRAPGLQLTAGRYKLCLSVDGFTPGENVRAEGSILVRINPFNS